MPRHVLYIGKLAEDCLALPGNTAMPYTLNMITLIESPIFSKHWPDYWEEDERGAFCAWLALNPDAGDVVSGSGGVRKIRWSRAGAGKSGGVRVIYVYRPEPQTIWLLTIYAKAREENVPAQILAQLRRALIDEEN